MALAFINYIFKIFIEEAIAFIGKRGAVTFINKRSLAVEKRLFKIAKARVNKRDLR